MTVIEDITRPAEPRDIAVLTQCIHHASHGLALHFWRQSAAPGQDPWEIGRARMAEKLARDEIHVIDRGAGAVAGLIGYPIGALSEEITDETPPIIRPLIALENLARESWYINVLAVLPGHRGRGLGAKLLDKAETVARRRGCPRLSLICADDNPGAYRLYRRQGFAETARRETVRDGWMTSGREWILMIRPLA